MTIAKKRKARRGLSMRKKLAEVFVEASPLVSITPGEMIREIRELQGLTQAELAKITGISQAAISALENGTQTLGIDRAKTLAEALKVHPGVLAFPDWNVKTA
jgi:DNA-binding XRE family transcriptional regulator